MCVLGLRRGRQILAQHEGSLESPWRWIGKLFPKGHLRSLKDDEHARYRRLLTRVVPAEPDPATLTVFGRICHSRLQELPRSATMTDLWRVASSITTDAMLLAIYGAERPSEAWRDLDGLIRRLGPEHPIWQPTGEIAEAYRAVHDHTRQIAISGGAKGGLGRLMSDLGADIVDETVIGNVVYFVELARYDLAGLLRWLVKVLSDEQALVDRVRTGAEPELPRAIVHETLRLHQAEGISRFAAADLDVEGYRIPKGTFLRIALRESHRDPEAFACPAAFVADRFVSRRPDPDAYAPFGLDRHRCIGSELALSLGAIFVEELARGYRWRTLADGPEHRGTYFWEPNVDFAVEIGQLRIADSDVDDRP